MGVYAMRMTMTRVVLLLTYNKIFCIIGASGSGKDHVTEHIALPKIVSYRTRDKRKGEVEGVNGYFISKEQFEEMDKQNQWIAKTIYSGHYYGITENELKGLEDSPLLYIVDEEGLRSLKESLSNNPAYANVEVVSIFIYSDRENVLKQMTQAGRDPSEIELRMARYDEDMKAKEQCDYIVENTYGYFMYAVKEVYDVILQTLLKGQNKHD